MLSGTDPEGGVDSILIRLHVVSSDETHNLANSLPADFVLKQNYPDDFNPSTTVRFGVPVPSVVRLTIYTLLGQRLEVLFEGSKNAGYHEIFWNARGMGSGMYILEMIAKSTEPTPREHRSSKRLLLQK